VELARGERDQLRRLKSAEPAVLTGCLRHGRVGSLVAKKLLSAGQSLFVIDEHEEVIAELRGQGIAGLVAGGAAVLGAANLIEVRALIVAIPDVFEAGQIVELARALNPRLVIIARGHSDAETAHLQQCGASEVVQGAEEIAHAMVEQYRGARSKDLERAVA